MHQTFVFPAIQCNEYNDIVSLAVFEENVEVLSQPSHRWHLCRSPKTLTFANISVITEDIYLNLRLVVYYQRITHTSRAGILKFFLT